MHCILLTNEIRSKIQIVLNNDSKKCFVFIPLFGGKCNINEYNTY